MDSLIYLTPTEGSSSFTNLSFYSILLNQLSEHYLKSKEKPILSIEKLDWVEPSALPNLVCLGLYLKNFHQEPIELRINYNPRLLHYLENVGFFKLIGPKSAFNPEALDIFNYNEGYIGGFGPFSIGSYNIKDIRKEHKIRCYFQEDKYSTIGDLKEKEMFRDNLIEQLESYILPEHFSTILYDNEITSENIYDTYERLAEPISNGILHSKSPTIVMIQTTKFKTKISISDAGIGFENSFKEKQLKFDFINLLKEKKVYQSKLHDFFFIQQILFYSTCKVREGLIDFVIDVILKNNGVVRIHYNSTQIIITTAFLNHIDKLKQIREKINTFLITNKMYILPTDHILYINAFDAIVNLGCAIQKNFKSDYIVSPLRLFDVNFKGVHIELDLIN